ncbi:hypothetical protein FACS189421_04280 [Bacteroidia bacterium]|nr:hypothetical protein FACS189421_04280 [Bacteroidia bacterium]GHT48065.1 hypothetical protein FACS189440_10680 [Bacteroidia bacterium]
MKRRDFLKTSAAVGVAALTFDKLSAAINSNEVMVESVPDMVAVMGGEPVPMLQRALKEMGGIGKYVKKGQNVVIKPNIGWDKKPDFAANTNPELIGELVKQCFEAGAKKVTVFDHTCDNWQRCYTNSGIEKAAKEAGATVMPGNDESYYKEIKIPGGVKLKSAKIHQAMLEADVWFNVPVLKNHDGAKMSIAMKNYMGIVWDRPYFHSNDLQQCIADACTWSKKPALNIIDAYRCMRKNGPQGRSVSDTSLLKALIVSPNIVAADTAAIGLFNQVEKMNINEVGHIANGETLKLGTQKLDKLNVKRIKL